MDEVRISEKPHVVELRDGRIAVDIPLNRAPDSFWLSFLVVRNLPGEFSVNGDSFRFAPLAPETHDVLDGVAKIQDAIEEANRQVRGFYEAAEQAKA